MFKNRTRSMFGLLLLGISLLSSSQIEETIPPSEEYHRNLSILNLLIQNVGFFKQACEAEYPEYKEANQNSFDAWTDAHGAFHDEILGMVDAALFQQISSDEDELKKVREDYRDRLAETQSEILDILKKTINDDGSDFKTWCSDFPSYTRSAITDIQTEHKDKIERMYAAKAMMDDEKTAPRKVISITRNNEIGKMKTGDLIMLLEAKIPFPKGEETIEDIVSLIDSTEHKIIEQTPDLLLIQGFKYSEATQQNEPAFQVEYHFKNGVYFKGPIVKQKTMPKKDVW